MFLQSGNIVLRAVEPADIDLLYSWENDVAIWGASNTITPYSRFQIEEYVLNAQYDLMSARQLRMMIDLQLPGSGKIPIGSIDLFEYDPVNRRAGLGILVLNEYRRKGYAAIALGMVIEYVRETLHLHQVFCNIGEDNTSSIALFEKLGFIKCGTKREWTQTSSGWKDEFILQMILEP
jgi:diamine N-acetyltransferase